MNRKEKVGRVEGGEKGRWKNKKKLRDARKVEGEGGEGRGEWEMKGGE